ncbi:hypothetical protein LOAG_10272 [Loa loa]|uniref:Uncharacterized protein n=1 Tax=Loa loa TaxID=7209 RepID=A0A1S0TQC8_LOALO|nr:hypothetical protein LOAG_10272 [Loa loa]EFO18223.1 hypothetical protein LOAG_10272 [Loa loa]
MTIVTISMMIDDDNNNDNSDSRQQRQPFILQCFEEFTQFEIEDHLSVHCNDPNYRIIGLVAMMIMTEEDCYR